MKHRLWTYLFMFVFFSTSLLLFQNCGNNNPVKKNTVKDTGVVSSASTHSNSNGVVSSSGNSTRYTGSGTGTTSGSGTGSTRSGTTTSGGGGGPSGTADTPLGGALAQTCITNAQHNGIPIAQIPAYCGFVAGSACHTGDKVIACAGVQPVPGCVQCGLDCMNGTWRRGDVCTL